MPPAVIHSVDFAMASLNKPCAKSTECITAGGTTPYPKLYGIKALAYNRLSDSVNAKASYDEYFKRQSVDKIGAGDYSSYATILLKFPGNETEAGKLVDKAVALDTLEANKVSYLKAIAVAYENQKKYKEAADWFSKVLTVKKNVGKTDLYYAGYDYFRANAFQPSINVFNQYVTKYPEDIFGYYMIGKANAGIDSTGALGLALPSYEKAIAIGEASADKEKVKAQLIGAYKYFIEYYYNVKKDQATALSYADKAIALDPTDTQLIANRELISKNDPKAPPKKIAAPKPPVKQKAGTTPKKK